MQVTLQTTWCQTNTSQMCVLLVRVSLSLYKCLHNMHRYVRTMFGIEKYTTPTGLDTSPMASANKYGKYTGWNGNPPCAGLQPPSPTV